MIMMGCSPNLMCTLENIPQNQDQIVLESKSMTKFHGRIGSELFLSLFLLLFTRVSTLCSTEIQTSYLENDFGVFGWCLVGPAGPRPPGINLVLTGLILKIPAGPVYVTNPRPRGQ
jgi:hypothetical protein